MKRRKFLISFSVLLIIVSAVIFHYRGYLKAQYHEIKRVTKGYGFFDFSFANATSKKVSFYSDSLKIVADLYESEIKNSPCLILAHGTNKLGRKQPIILSIAKEFQKLGYTVLAIDFRGYNESEAPHKINSVKDIDFGKDIISAVDYVINHTNIDTSKIFVFGHSFGAGATLSAQARDKKIKKIILLGPPRRITERIINSHTSESYYLLNRQVSNMSTKVKADTSILIQEVQKRNIANYIGEFSTPKHIPIFLIDGGKEDVKDREFLKNIYNKMIAPKDYWTVPGVNHYLNTGVIFNKPIYCTSILRKFVRKIDNWIKS